MKYNIGLLGCGNIGTKVATEILSGRYNELNLTKILVKDLGKSRENIPTGLLTDCADDILNDPDIHIVIEVLGNEYPAKDYILQAISQKKQIVTANKELIAKHGSEIYRTALQHKVNVRIEASVAGGIPIISTILHDLKANKISCLYGILNGTTNYILTEMQKGNSFESALQSAQDKGYAEPDPTNDVQGYDVKYKTAILASLASHTNISPDNINCKGITNINSFDFWVAKEFGYNIKLLGVINIDHTTSEVMADVYPHLIVNTHPLANVNDVLNGVYIRGDLVGDLTLIGAGAGASATASSILGDVLNITNSPDNLNLPSLQSQKDMVANQKQIENGYYLRFEVADEIGVMAQITNVLKEHDISIESIIQKQYEDKMFIAILAHKITENKINLATNQLKNLAAIQHTISLLKIF